MEDLTLEEMTRDEQVEHWVNLKAQIKELKIEADECEQLIIELAEGQSWMVDRIGLVEVRYGSRKVIWDGDLLWSAAIEHGRTHRELNPDTGDVKSEAESVGASLRKLFGASPNFTRGGVTSVGLIPEQFSEKGAASRSTISVTGAS